MKDQFVIAHLTFTPLDQVVLSYCRFLSTMLSKGIILFYVADPRYGTLSANEATPKLQELQQELQQEGFSTLYCALTGNTKTAISLLPTKFNGVVAVVAVDATARRRTPSYPKEVLRHYSESKIAYLTVQQPLTNTTSLQRIALSIDFNKESKDKLIWSSYFARFNHSTIILLSENYKDDGLRQKWCNNIAFLNKFYRSLNLTYQQQFIVRRGPFLDVCATEYSQQLGFGMLISVTTDPRAKDALEFFIGTQEEKVVRNPQLLPILFINPRNDIYVLCD